MAADSHNPYMDMPLEDLIALAEANGVEIPVGPAPQPVPNKPEHKPYSYDSFADQLKETQKNLPSNLKEAGRKFGVGARGVLSGIGDIDFGRFGTGDTIEKGIDTLTNDYFKPRTEAEQNSHDLSRLLSGTNLTGAGIYKAANLTSKAAKSMPSAFSKLQRAKNAFVESQAIQPTAKAHTLLGAGAVGGDTAARYLHENPYFDPALDPTLAAVTPMLGGMAGSLTTGAALHKLPKIAQRVTNPKLAADKAKVKFWGFDPKIYGSIIESGHTPTLGETTKNKAISTAQLALAKLGTKGLGEVGEKRMPEFLHSLGIGDNPGTKASLGTKIVEQLKNARTKSSQYYRAQANKFEGARKKANLKHVPLTESLKGLEAAKPKNVHEEAMEYWDSTLAGKYLKEIKNIYGGDFDKALKSDPKLKEVLKKQGIVTDNVPTWESAHNLKKRVGYDVGPAFETTGDAHIDALQPLYHNIGHDVENAMKSVSDPKLRTELLTTYKDYKRHGALFKGKNEPIINEAIMAEKHSPAKVVDSLIRNARQGKDSLEYVMEVLPKGGRKDYMTDLTYAMSMDRKGNVSPNKFFDNYDRFSPELQKSFKEAFTDATGLPGNRIDRLKEATSHMKEYIGLSNTSNTSLHSSIYNKVFKGGAYKALTGGVSLQDAIDPILTWAGLNALDRKVFTNQKFLKSLDYAAKVEYPSQVNILLNKLEKVPGMNHKMIQSFRNSYNEVSREAMRKVPQYKTRLLMQGLREPSHSKK